MANLMANLAVSLIGQLLYMVFAPKPPDVEGPRLESLNIPAISPGNPINRVWGTMTVPGQLIWTTGLKETVHTKKVKGGKGAKSQKVTTYTYSTSVAVAVCEGPVQSIRRIKAQQKVVYEDAGVSLEDDLEAYTAARQAFWEYHYSTYPTTIETNGGDGGNTTTVSYEGAIQRKVNEDVSLWKKENNYEDQEYPEYGTLRTYLGTEDQLPDPTMEGVLGIGAVPAHRGIAYFVIEDLQLADFGNAIPTFTVEVVQQDGRVSVYTIVKDLCESAGLVQDDSFVLGRELENYLIHGYALTALTSVRAAIESLQQVHPFEGIERGDHILFRSRDRAAIGGVLFRDMRADDSPEGASFRLERTRIDDLQLPRRIELAFQDVNRDYSQNKVYIARTFTQSNAVKSMSLTIASDPATMKRAVEIQMAEAYAARNALRCRLPAKYLRYTPGDIVRVETEEGDWRQSRITGMSLGANFIIEMDLQDYMGSESGLVALADARVADSPGRDYTSDTETFILDVPSLDDTQLESGVYVLFGSYPGRWDGGALFRNTGAGTTEYFGETVESETTQWELEYTNINRIAWGTATAVLPEGTAYGVDRGSPLVVQFLSGEPVFTGLSLDDAVTSTENTFMVGDEIVQALTVELVGDGLWIFRDLLRGLRGTDWAMHQHQVGDRVIHLTEDALIESRWNLSTTLIGTAIEYRAATQGQDVLRMDTETFVYQGGYNRAFAPDIINAVRDATGNLTFEINPRAKFNGIWANGAPTALTDANNYLVEIWDDEFYGTGASLVRTLSLVGTVNGSYTAAEQTTDFGSPQAVLYVRAYQIADDGLRSYEKITAI